MRKKDKPSIMHILQNTLEFNTAEVAVAEEVCDYYLKNLSRSGYYIFLATGPETIGYICYGPTPLTEGTWDIYWIAVAREAQSKSIGKSLLSFAERKIQEEKGRMVLIETSSRPEYERTRQFYYSQGYKVISSIPDFYSHGDDKLTLRKLLSCYSLSPCERELE